MPDSGVNPLTPERDLLPDELLGTTDRNPPDIGLLALIREDFVTHGRDCLEQGFWAITVHRFGNWRMRIRSRFLRLPFSLLYLFLARFVEWTCGITIHYWVEVGRRVRIWHHSGILIGARRIGDDVQLRQNTTLGSAHFADTREQKPIIEDRVDIGAGVVILGSIRVGHDSVIGANAVVVDDVPPYSVAVGVPARVIKRRVPESAPAPRSAARS